MKIDMCGMTVTFEMRQRYGRDNQERKRVYTAGCDELTCLQHFVDRNRCVTEDGWNQCQSSQSSEQCLEMDDAPREFTCKRQCPLNSSYSSTATNCQTVKPNQSLSHGLYVLVNLRVILSFGRDSVVQETARIK